MRGGLYKIPDLQSRACNNRKYLEKEYQLKIIDPGKSQIEMLKKQEIPSESYEEIVKCCREKEIIFPFTLYNVEHVVFFDELGVPASKQASIHMAEPYFSRYVAKE